MAGITWLLLSFIVTMGPVAAEAAPASVAAKAPVENRAGEEPWGDEIVVTATRRPEPVRAVPTRIEVLDQAALQRTAGATLDDRLRSVAGFSLLRRAGSRVAHPTTQGVSLRGLGASGACRSLVVLDGVVLNDPFGGWVAWSRVPSTSLERVEVAFGSHSDTWGTGALGGVLQLITTTPRQRQLAVGATAGERSEGQLSLSGGWRGARTSALAEVRGFESGGHPVLRADQRGAIDVPARSRHQTLYATLSHDGSPSTTWRLRGNAFNEHRGNGTPLARNQTEGGYLAGSLDHVVRRDTAWHTDVVVQRLRFANTFSAQADDRASERPALDQFDVGSDAVRLGGWWSRGGTGGTHHVTVGTELQWLDAATHEDFFYRGDTQRFLRRRRAGGEQRTAALFVQDALRLGNRWRVHASLRADQWQARDGSRVEQVIEDGTLLRDDQFADRERTAVSPRLGVRVAIGTRASAYASAFGAFRAPTVNELYRPFRVRNDITAANASLVPERLRGGEAGGSWRNRRLTLQGTAYWNQVDDPLANVTVGPGPGLVGPCGFVPAGGTCRQRSNLGRTRVRGLELDTTLALGQTWRLRASYNRVETRVLEAQSQPTLVGNQLPQVPAHQGVFALERTGGTFTGRLALRYLGHQFEDDLNQRRLNDHIVVDLTLQRAVRPGLDVYLNAENLLDETIESGRSANGLTTLGAPRLLSVGFRWRWRDHLTPNS